MSDENTSGGQNIVPWKNEASETALRDAAEEQRRFMSKAAEFFKEANRGLGHGAVEETQMTLTFMAGQGDLRDLQACMSKLIESVIRTNLRQAQELFLVDSPSAFIELHQRFMREYFQTIQQGIEALIRAAKGASSLSPIG
jgi:hypothetical protein